MGPDQQRLTPNERADLVAYLDGELGDADARVIATKLAHSATARREVESLEKAWELLDHLPRPRAADDFTARTLTEIARREVEAGELGTAVVRTTRHLVRALVWIGLALAGFGLGYVLMQQVFWPNPSERLTRELPIAEHLEEYRDVGTFEFLQELVESPEFNADRD
jgi:anti-sigma factor RsiW